jgi:transcriptional regulator with XRE-family HTH domain
MADSGAQKLKAWLKRHGLSMTKFGERIGVKRQSVSYWVNQAVVPSFQSAVAIELGTSYVAKDDDRLVDPVRVEDWYERGTGEEWKRLVAEQRTVAERAAERDRREARREGAEQARAESLHGPSLVELQIRRTALSSARLAGECSEAEYRAQAQRLDEALQQARRSVLETAKETARGVHWCRRTMAGLPAAAPKDGDSSE